MICFEKFWGDFFSLFYHFLQCFIMLYILKRFMYRLGATTCVYARPYCAFIEPAVCAGGGTYTARPLLGSLRTRAQARCGVCLAAAITTVSTRVLCARIPVIYGGGGDGGDGGSGGGNGGGASGGGAYIVDLLVSGGIDARIVMWGLESGERSSSCSRGIGAAFPIGRWDPFLPALTARSLNDGFRVMKVCCLQWLISTCVS